VLGFVVFESVGNLLILYGSDLGDLALILPLMLKSVTLCCISDQSPITCAGCSLIICGLNYRWHLFELPSSTNFWLAYDYTVSLRQQTKRLSKPLLALAIAMWLSRHPILNISAIIGYTVLVSQPLLHMSTHRLANKVPLLWISLEYSDAAPCLQLLQSKSLKIQEHALR
jgi:hypothetical protein